MCVFMPVLFARKKAEIKCHVQSVGQQVSRSAGPQVRRSAKVSRSVIALPMTSYQSYIHDLSAANIKSLAALLALSGRSKLSNERLTSSIINELSSSHDLSRSIDIWSDAVQYSDNDTFYKLENALGSFNCHHGQRKLFFTMLEFMSMCALRMKMTDCIVVYVGAAPGYNMRMIADMFPTAHYLLIDPAPFDIKETNNITLWRTLFDDDKIQSVLDLQRIKKRAHILFVSDIRLNPAQEDIARDMLMQQRWGIKMNASSMMLKFKLPYYGMDSTNKIVEDAQRLVNIQNAVEVPKTKPPGATHYLYLDGTIHLQLYAPLRSAETRLIVFRPPGGAKSRYLMRYYDFKKYEAKLNAFNIVGRSLMRFTVPNMPESMQLGDHLLGYGDDYESVTEFQLAYNYLLIKLNINNNNNNVTPSLRDVVVFLHRLNMQLVQHYSSKVSLVLCAIKTMALHTKKYNEIPDQSAREHQIRVVANNVLARFKKQLSVVAKSTLLSDREKREMVDVVSREIDALRAL